MQNIVFVVGQLGKGGLERQLLYLIRQLLQENVRVTCVVWNFNEDDPFTAGYRKVLQNKLIGLGENQSTLGKIQKLRGLVINEKPQLVISFTGFVNAAVYLAAWGLKSIAIGSLRTSAQYYLQTGGLIAKLNLLLPPMLLVNSQQAIKELEKAMFIRMWTKTSFYPNVIPVQDFQTQEVRHEIFQSISIGNALHYKKLTRLIDTVELLRNRGVYDFQHIHIGAGPDLPKLQENAKSRGLQDQLQFLGPKDEVAIYLVKSDLFLHFSDYEGSPNVIMEAMAAGLPIITTNCGDASKYVHYGHNGFVIEPYSTAVFADQFICLKSNKVLRENMGDKSRQIIQKSDINNLSRIFQHSLAEFGLAIHYPL